ncbi:ABC transporter A, ABCA, partial [Kipferlia bialata]|eukprot:g6997.t1
MGWGLQFQALLKKQFLTNLRNVATLVLQIVVLPVAFMYLIVYFDSIMGEMMPSIAELSSVVPHGESSDVATIPAGCVLGYTPMGMGTDAIMTTVASDLSCTMVDYADADAMNAALIADPTAFDYGVLFTSFDSEGTFDYEIQYDMSGYVCEVVDGMNMVCHDQYLSVEVPLMTAIDNAILELYGKGSITVSATREYARYSISAFSTESTFGSIFTFIALSIAQAIAATQVSREREQGHRRSLQILGMKSSAYWLSVFVVLFLVVMLESVVIIGCGYAFGIKLVSENDLSLLLITFAMNALTSCGVCYLFGALIPTSKLAGLASFVYIIVFYMIGSMSSFLFVDTVDTSVQYVLAMFPPVTLMRSLTLLANNAALKQFGLDTLSLSTAMDTDSVTPTMPIGTCWVMMLVQTVLLAVIGSYCDTVVQSGRTFLLRFRKPSMPKTSPSDTIHASVRQERQTAQAAYKAAMAVKKGDELPADLPSIIVNRLSMQFRRIPDIRHKFPAVDDVSFSVPAGAVFALLGENGAGKTTTVNCLIGNYHATEGDSLLMGKPIHEVRERVGLCPQFDVVWDMLTAREHVELFARIKGIEGKHISALSSDLLGQMGLSAVSDSRVATFSGGMRR